MANNTGEYTLLINAIGDLTKAIKQNKNFAASANEAAAAQDRARKASKKHNDILNGGVASANNAGRSMSKLIETVGGNNSGLVAAYATLATNAFAVSAAFSALRNAAQVEQMMKGLEVQGARTGKNLKGLSNDLQEITNYSISAADAMQATALMSSAGFSSQGMKDLVTVANNAALALGRNVPDSLDRISKGVTKLEPELLDELGIMTKLTEAQSAYALENNKSVGSLTSFEKRQAMLNAVVAEGTAKFGGLSDQVGANPYDKLAATFSNLTNNVLGFVNTVAGPLAAVLGSNQGLLLGALILFVSSIRKQMLPALAQMSENAIKAKDIHLQEAEAIKTKTAATLADAKATRLAALETARSSVGTIAGKANPRSFRVKELQEGTLSLKEMNKELDRLNKSITGREKSIEGTGFKVDPSKIPQKKVELQLIKQERDNLAALIKLETEGDSTIKPLREEAIKGKLEYIKQQKLAAMEGKKAEALEAASSGTIKGVIESWGKAKEAVEEYKKSIKAEGMQSRVQEGGNIKPQTGLGRLSEKIKGSIGSVGIYTSTMTAGIMSLLPYIGTATTALSAAWSVYQNFIKSDADKARTEALNKLKETLDNTRKSVEELNRLNEASIPIGLKAAQTLTIQSNATAEIAGAFDEVKNAAEKAKNNTETDSIWKVIIGSPEDAVSYATGVAKDSEFFKPIADELKNSTASYGGAAAGALIGGMAAFFAGPAGPLVAAATVPLGVAIGNRLGTAFAQLLPEELNGIDEEAIASFRAMDQLSKILNKDVYDSMIKAAGGADNLAKSPALRDEFLRQAASAYVGVADAVKSLQEAFKQTGTAITQFFTSAIPTTPFDGLVKGYSSVNKAFQELDSTIGGSNMKEQVKLMSSMPEEMIKLLSVPQQQIIQNLQKESAQLEYNKTLIDDLVKKGKDRSNEEERQLNYLTQQNISINKNMETYYKEGEAIKQSLRDTEATLKSNQRQSILYNSQLSLVNAISSANSEIYSKSAEGEKARIQRHNEAIRLQQAQLNLQISITETYIAQAEAQIDLLEIQQVALKVTKEMDTASMQKARNDAETAKNIASTAALSAGLTQEYLDSIDAVIARKKQLGPDALMKATIDYNRTGDLLKAAEAYGSAQKGLEIASFRAANSINIESHKDQISSFNQQVSALRNSVAALDESIIGTNQEAGLIAKRQAELAKAEEARQLQIKEITIDNNEVLRASYNLTKQRANAIYETIRATTIQLSKDKERAAQEAGSNIKILEAERKIYEGRLKDRPNMAQPEKESYEAAIKSLDTQIAQENQLNILGQQRLDVLAQQSILQSIIGQGLGDSLQKLQESIQGQQKLLDLTNEVAQKEMQIAQNRSKLAITKMGGTVDEDTQKQFAVEAAEIAYKAAQENYILRQQSIDAEYALLKVQREAESGNIKAQIYLIKAFAQVFNVQSKELQDNLDALTSAAARIEATDTTAMKNLAKRSAAADLELSRQALEQAKAERDTVGMPKWLSPITNLMARIESRNRAEATANSPINESRTPTIVRLDAQVEELKSQVSLLVQIRDNLNKVLPAVIPQTNTETVGEQISSSVATSLSKSQVWQNLIQQESGGRQFKKNGETLTSSKGAIGIAQLIPKYGPDFAKMAGTTWDESKARKDKDYNLKLGYANFENLIKHYGGDLLKAAAAYNAGPGKIDKLIEEKGKDWRSGLGRETRDYIKTIFKGMAQEKRAILKSSSDIAANPSVINTTDNGTIGTPEISTLVAVPASLETTATAAGQAAESAKLKFSDLFETINTAFAVSMGIMEDLGAQMSERLGQDFGPQGKILSSIANLSKELEKFATNMSKSWEGLFPKMPVLEGIGGPMNNFPVAMNAQSVSSVSGMTQPVNTSLAGSASAAAPAAPLTGGVDNIGSSLSGLSGLSQTTTELTGGLDNLASKASETAKLSTDSIKAASVEVDTAQTKTTEGFNKQMQSASVAFGAIAGMIGAVAGLLKSSSDAKIAGIDKEIAAEQRRDGKSAASVAKLDALEKKKDNQARKSFNTQKKLMMAQAVMATAAGVANALGSAKPPMNFILAGIIGAMGAAQIAIIASTQYDSSYKAPTAAMPSNLSIGKRSDTVDLAKGPNASAGGEVGYLRGASGQGTNATNYRTVGSAYGGELMRGYGNRGFVVGEKGPEVITPETPISVTPANDVGSAQPINANFTIQALDSNGVQDILVSQKGNIIKMLREAANASGKTFMEDVNVNVYTRPQVNRL